MPLGVAWWWLGDGGCTFDDNTSRLVGIRFVQHELPPLLLAAGQGSLFVAVRLARLEVESWKGGRAIQSRVSVSCRR